jgi:phosphatidate cytidylyltransferase
MGMTLYLIILGYFLFGGLSTFHINKKYPGNDKKQNWLKFCTYFIIVNFLFASVMINSLYFHYLSIIIIMISFFEIIRLTYTTGKLKTGVLSLLGLTFFSYTFLGFSSLDKQLLIIVLFIVCIFDGFSQLAGQVLGKIKFLPRISPKKTIEGLIGGYLFSLISSVLIFKLLNKEFVQSVYIGFGLCTFSFLGDLSASLIKRKFEVKDFSSLLPGHGGFLDRFDGLIFSGSFMYIITLYINL